LTETCLFDDITARRWTIDKAMDDYYSSICIESTFKVSFYLVDIDFLGFSMASHPIAARLLQRDFRKQHTAKTTMAFEDEN
jgi:hypothetical protein